MRILGCDGFHLFVPAEKLEEASDFYGLFLGLPHQPSKIYAGAIQLNIPGTTVSLRPASGPLASGCTTVLDVEDLDAWITQLQDTGFVLEEFPPHAGLRRLQFPDGFGNHVEMRERIPYDV